MVGGWLFTLPQQENHQSCWHLILHKSNKKDLMLLCFCFLALEIIFPSSFQYHHLLLHRWDPSLACSFLLLRLLLASFGRKMSSALFLPFFLQSCKLRSTMLCSSLALSSSDFKYCWTLVKVLYSECFSSSVMVAMGIVSLGLLILTRKF